MMIRGGLDLVQDLVLPGIKSFAFDMGDQLVFRECLEDEFDGNQFVHFEYVQKLVEPLNHQGLIVRGIDHMGAYVCWIHITHDSKSTSVAEHLTREEIEWLVDILKAAIYRRSGRRV